MLPQPLPTQIDTWQAAEVNAAAWMRHWGFTDARVTPGGPDGGVDVRSARALAQVKFEAAQVGAPALQRLVGARGRAHDLALFFFSGAGFARPAVEYADDMGIALFKYGLDGSMTPFNASARRVLKQAQTVEARDFPLEEVRAWADAAAAKRDAAKAVSDGWWRRNGWLISSIFCAVGTLTMGMGALTGPSETDAGSTQVGGWEATLVYLGMSVGSYLLWEYFRNKRQSNARRLAGLPDAGPVPAAARTLASGMAGTRAGATFAETMAAMEEANKVVPGLSMGQCKTIVEALQQQDSEQQVG